MGTEAEGESSGEVGVGLNEISQRIIDAAYLIHAELGPGLLETVCCVLLGETLRDGGLKVQREVPIPIRPRGKVFDEGFRADLIVEQSVIVEVGRADRPGSCQAAHYVSETW
jgi:iron complex transport system substrate-binding protein